MFFVQTAVDKTTFNINSYTQTIYHKYYSHTLLTGRLFGVLYNIITWDIFKHDLGPLIILRY